MTLIVVRWTNRSVDGNLILLQLLLTADVNNCNES